MSLRACYASYTVHYTTWDNNPPFQYPDHSQSLIFLGMRLTSLRLNLVSARCLRGHVLGRVQAVAEAMERGGWKPAVAGEGKEADAKEAEGDEILML
eukprot:3411271-Rhodomonas_salina.2